LGFIGTGLLFSLVYDINFCFKKTELHLKPGVVYNYGFDRHCKSSFLMVKKQKVKKTFFWMQNFDLP